MHGPEECHTKLNKSEREQQVYINTYMHCSFLTASPLSLHPFPSLIATVERLPCPGAPQVFCLVSNPGHGFQYGLSSVQFSSLTQSCPTLCDPMDCSMPGLPVHHQLLEFTQTHVYWVGDTIQPSHSLSSPSLPAFNLSQHQGIFQWVSSLH